MAAPWAFELPKPLSKPLVVTTRTCRPARRAAAARLAPADRIGSNVAPSWADDRRSIATVARPCHRLSAWRMTRLSTRAVDGQWIILESSPAW